MEDSTVGPDTSLARARDPRVAVLVVHGVNAPVPDPDFSTLQAVTELLVNHDFGKEKFTYNPSSVTQFSVQVTDVSQTLAARKEGLVDPDRGNLAMRETIENFRMRPSYWNTERRETKRVPVNGGSWNPIEVHLYELYWADLSRPHAFSVFNTFLAFLSLLFSACSLGRKSVGEAISRMKAEGQIDPSALKPWTQLTALQFLLFFHGLLEQMLTAVLPSLNIWLAGAAWSYYLLSLDGPAHDAIVPTILGLVVIILYLQQFVGAKTRQWPWQTITIISVVSGLLTVFFTLQGGTNFPGLRWSLTLLCGILVPISLVYFYARRPEMARSVVCANGISLAAVVALAYEVLQRIDLPEFSDLHCHPNGLKSTIILWCDSICTAVSLAWLVVALLSLTCLIGAGFLGAFSWPYGAAASTARAVRTTLISTSAPSIILLVITLGLWQIAAWLLGVQFSQSDIPDHFISHIPNHYLWPVHAEPSFLGHVNEVQKAASLWYSACQHPWIQFAYLWFIVVATFLAIAMAPNVALEIVGPTKTFTQAFAAWVGRATDALYRGLTFSGLAIAKLMGVLAPLVMLAVAYFFPAVVKHGTIGQQGQTLFISVAVVYLVGTITLRMLRLRGQYYWRAVGLAALNAAVTALAIGIVAVEFDLNIVWALPLSALFVLAGIAFIFRTILNAALDVTNWLRLTPRENNPRGNIVARLWALLEKIKKEDYDGMVVVAHSQGTVIAVEFLRYLQFIECKLSNPIYLFTVGCPLRQLYARRFPDLYSWVGYTPEEAVERLKPPSGVVRWLNGYTTGDYIGRNLWTRQLNRDDVSEEPSAFSDNREELCLGAGAHIHYFDWRFEKMAELLDGLILDSAAGRRT